MFTSSIGSRAPTSQLSSISRATRSCTVKPSASMYSHTMLVSGFMYGAITEIFFAPSVFSPWIRAPALVTTGAAALFCRVTPMKSRLGFPVIALAHAHDRDQAGVTEHVDTRIRQL